MSNNYLLLKVSVLEHVSANEACRIGEDFLTIICDAPPPSPTPQPTSFPNTTPTPTPSPTPQPSLSFNNSLLIIGAVSVIGSSSNNGITLTSYGGTNLSYNSKSGLSTISSMSLRQGNPNNFTEIGRVVFIDAYLNDAFSLQYNGGTYRLNFVSGPVYL